MSNVDGAQLLYCYNRGCGQQFDEKKNDAEACCYHPGEPFFHDAYKGWSCCKKKCTDFTEFLNTKGCTKSFHSNIKPPEPEKPKVKELGETPVIVAEVPRQPVPAPVERPDEDLPLVKLPVSVTSSLKQALEKLELNAKVPTVTAANQISDIASGIPIGEACKNGGCKVSYTKDHAEGSSKCLHHPGYPVFHEGLKFWSCCQRKTTDFTSFMDQEGCTAGSHVWIKKDSEKKVSCRHDWHQTGGQVVVTVYAKNCDPDRSYVEANPVKLRIGLVFNEGVFEEELLLFGVIEVEKSKVEMAASKVEIKLKKCGPMSWGKLSLPQTVQTETSLVKAEDDLKGVNLA